MQYILDSESLLCVPSSLLAIVCGRIQRERFEAGLVLASSSCDETRICNEHMISPGSFSFSFEMINSCADAGLPFFKPGETQTEVRWTIAQEGIV